MRTVLFLTLSLQSACFHVSTSYPAAAAPAAPSTLVFGYGPGWQAYQQRQAAKAAGARPPVVVPIKRGRP